MQAVFTNRSNARIAIFRQRYGEMARLCGGTIMHLHVWLRVAIHGDDAHFCSARGTDSQ